MKFCRLRLRPGVAGCQPSIDNAFGRPVIHRPENVERREEKEIDGVEIKLKRHFVIQFRLIKGIGDNFGVIIIVE